MAAGGLRSALVLEFPAGLRSGCVRIKTETLGQVVFFRPNSDGGVMNAADDHRLLNAVSRTARKQAASPLALARETLPDRGVPGQ